MSEVQVSGLNVPGTDLTDKELVFPQKGVPKRLPLSDEILKAMKVGESSIIGSFYVVKVLEDKLKNSKLKPADYSEILDRVIKYRHLVVCKLTGRGDSWGGEAGSPSDFINMQRNLADDLAKVLEGTIGDNLQFDFAINERAQLLQVFSSGGNAVDPQKKGVLEELFNAWLAENKIVSEGSILYEADINGNILEKNGEKVRANSEKVKELISDERGLGNYLQSKIEGVPVTIQPREVPGTAQVTTQSNTVVTQQKAEKPQKIEEVLTEEPGINQTPT